MPVNKQKNGTYTVRYYVDDPVAGKRKQIKRRGFTTRREAIAWEAESKSARETQATSLTFWEVFQTNLDNADTSQSTRHKKETWIKQYCDFCDKPIEKITKPMLIRWRNGLKETDLAVRTMNAGMQYVRSVFSFYSDVFGRENAGVILKSFKMTKSNMTEMQIWTVEDFNRFAECVKNPAYRLYFEFLFWTGCRRGEGIALTGGDFSGDMCHIHRSMKHYCAGFTPLKTESSERTIRIDSQLMDKLKPYISNADPFVFGGDHPLAISNIQKYFTRAVQASGVTPIRLHDLRHSHASFLLNNGANILAVSKRLGHATITQTLETYAHLLSETDEKMMEIIENKKK